MSDLGIALAMMEARAKPEDHEDTKLARLVELLQAAGAYNNAMTWPRSEAFSDLVMNRTANHEHLAEDFKLKDAPARELDALSELQGYRALSDDRIRQLVDVVRAEVESGQVEPLQRFFEVYRVVYYLAKLGVVPETPEEWTQKVLEAIGRCDPKEVRSMPGEFWFGQYDAHESQVIRAIRDVESASNAEKAVRDRLLARQAILDGDVSQDRTSVVFADALPSEFFESIKKKGSGSIYALTRFFRSRLGIGNGPDFFGEDRDFAVSLSELIEKQIPLKRPMTISDANFRELSAVLRVFADKVDSYQKAKGEN
jgi:hypothetical protein